MKKLILLIVVALMAVGASAQQKNGPRKVTLEKEGNEWVMKVDGKPFFVHGASIYNRQPFFPRLSNYGANTARIFNLKNDPDYVLKAMNKVGLMCHVGLGFKSIRSGYYDADEAAAIAEQEKAIIENVKKYKDHPAVLCWSIGNEFEIGNAEKPLTAQYESINRLARMIHEIDPNHPVTLAIEDRMTPAKLKGIVEICKDLDFLCINGYIEEGNRFDLPELVKEIGWEKPYMSTELGPEGWWMHERLSERRYTDWGAVIDYTSTEKEGKYEYCMTTLYKDPACIGVLTFLWGNQTGSRDEVLEWYGLLDPNGYTYGAVDVMQRYWTGYWPAARSPRIEKREDLTMNGEVASSWIRVDAGTKNKASVKVGNPAGVPLRYHWRIVPERSRRADNKFHDGIEGLIENNGKTKVNFIAPYKPGAYRLYVHVYDDVNKKAAYASIPFYVNGNAAELEDYGGRP